MDMTPSETFDMEQQQAMESNTSHYASTSDAQQPMEYHQMMPQNIQFNGQYLEQMPIQQQYSNQYVYEMPRASSSSAIHGLLGTSNVQQVIVDETPSSLIRPLVSQEMHTASN